MGEVPIVIGIAGGSGSGKTTFAIRLMERLGNEFCGLMAQDSYYFDRSKDFDYEGGRVNFDHPSALDFDLLANHLEKLLKGEQVDVPLYDYKTHRRLRSTQTQEPRPVILLDGTLLLSQEPVRKWIQHKIFLEVDEETRFQRRLKRDVNERGRTPEGVERQFFQQVKPMHDEFVEPSKHFADFVVKDALQFDRCLGQLMSVIQKSHPLRA